ncbi:hypothetical protein Poly21_07930 [Allorhodopirellula heiligendammensis]|uniref:Uncharacterized protein n=1 Tax=Allorhodopirellula heiligendammensis TaxID=2714739 RepID=A0A5C6C7B4_9BACT|nr:hypothetical protein Poly21_07930 [Allorhodopirellula heiligendammensis]
MAPGHESVHHEAGGQSVASPNPVRNIVAPPAMVACQHTTTPCRFSDKSPSKAGRILPRLYETFDFLGRRTQTQPDQADAGHARRFEANFRESCV